MAGDHDDSGNVKKTSPFGTPAMDDSHTTDSHGPTGDPRKTLSLPGAFMDRKELEESMAQLRAQMGAYGEEQEGDLVVVDDIAVAPENVTVYDEKDDGPESVETEPVPQPSGTIALGSMIKQPEQPQEPEATVSDLDDPDSVFPENPSQPFFPPVSIAPGMHQHSGVWRRNDGSKDMEPVEGLLDDSGQEVEIPPAPEVSRRVEIPLDQLSGLARGDVQYSDLNLDAAPATSPAEDGREPIPDLSDDIKMEEIPRAGEKPYDTLVGLGNQVEGVDFSDDQATSMMDHGFQDDLRRESSGDMSAVDLPGLDDVPESEMPDTRVDISKTEHKPGAPADEGLGSMLDVVPSVSEPAAEPEDLEGTPSAGYRPTEAIQVTGTAPTAMRPVVQEGPGNDIDPDDNVYVDPDLLPPPSEATQDAIYEAIHGMRRKIAPPTENIVGLVAGITTGDDDGFKAVIEDTVVPELEEVVEEKVGDGDFDTPEETKAFERAAIRASQDNIPAVDAEQVPEQEWGAEVAALDTEFPSGDLPELPSVVTAGRDFVMAAGDEKPAELVIPENDAVKGYEGPALASEGIGEFVLDVMDKEVPVSSVDSGSKSGRHARQMTIAKEEKKKTAPMSRGKKAGIAAIAALATVATGLALEAAGVTDIRGWLSGNKPSKSSRGPDDSIGPIASAPTLDAAVRQADRDMQPGMGKILPFRRSGMKTDSMEHGKEPGMSSGMKPVQLPLMKPDTPGMEYGPGVDTMGSTKTPDKRPEPKGPVTSGMGRPLVVAKGDNHDNNNGSRTKTSPKISIQKPGSIDNVVGTKSPADRQPAATQNLDCVRHYRVQFRYAKTQYKGAAAKGISDWVRNYIKDGQTVFVNAGAGTIGKKDYNRRLSRRRARALAETVRAVAKRQGKKVKLVVKWHGEVGNELSLDEKRKWSQGRVSAEGLSTAPYRFGLLSTRDTVVDVNEVKQTIDNIPDGESEENCRPLLKDKDTDSGDSTGMLIPQEDIMESMFASGAKYVEVDSVDADTAPQVSGDYNVWDDFEQELSDHLTYEDNREQLLSIKESLAESKATMVALDRKIDELVVHECALAVDLSQEQRAFLFREYSSVQRTIKDTNDVHLRVTDLQKKFRDEYGCSVSAQCVRESVIADYNTRIPEPAQSEETVALTDTQRDLIYNSFTSTKAGATMDERLANAHFTVNFWSKEKEITMDAVKEVVMAKAYDNMQRRAA